MNDSGSRMRRLIEAAAGRSLTLTAEEMLGAWSSHPGREARLAAATDSEWTAIAADIESWRRWGDGAGVSAADLWRFFDDGLARSRERRKARFNLARRECRRAIRDYGTALAESDPAAPLKHAGSPRPILHLQPPAIAAAVARIDGAIDEMAAAFDPTSFC